jgi:plastocyanin
VTIPVGQSVAFVNNDSVAHDMASDPFPQYTDCPAVNRVGNLEAGQRMQTGPSPSRARAATTTC